MLLLLICSFIELSMSIQSPNATERMEGNGTNLAKEGDIPYIAIVRLNTTFSIMSHHGAIISPNHILVLYTIAWMCFKQIQFCKAYVGQIESNVGGQELNVIRSTYRQMKNIFEDDMYSIGILRVQTIQFSSNVRQINLPTENISNKKIDVIISGYGIGAAGFLVSNLLYKNILFSE